MALENPAALPPLVLRVGTISSPELPEGQLDRLKPQISAFLDLVRRDMIALAETAQAQRGYIIRAGETPHLRLLSSLAEGVDQIVAEIALDEGFELVCPLPLPIADYEGTFHSEQSKEQFRRLLARADTRVLELDGARGDDEDRSIEAAQHLIVRNCDLLIAIWDGSADYRPGGTAAAIQFASNYGPPVWWIHARENRAPVWLTDPRDIRASTDNAGDASAALHVYLAKLILPPTQVQPQAHTLFERVAQLCRGQRAAPFAIYRTSAARPKRRLWQTYNWVMRSIAGGAPAPWTPPRAPANPVARYWFDCYQPADARAGEYASRYRSAYVWVFALATLAVSFATLALAPEVPKPIMTGLEFLALLLIAVLVFANERREWHPHFIGYRLLAELCRKQQALAPVGWSLAGPPVRAKLNLANEAASAEESETAEDRASWVEWFFGALQRAAPLPHGRFDPNLIAGAKEAAIIDLIGEQLDYHATRGNQSRRAGARFAQLGEIMFLLVLIVVAIKLSLIFKGASHFHLSILVLGLLAAILPAFSAGFVGIRAYAELPLLADQSRHMLAEMTSARTRIARLGTTQPLASQELGSEIYSVAMLMLQDVQGWVQLFRAKVVEPG